MCNAPKHTHTFP